MTRLVPSDRAWGYDGSFDGLLALVFALYARGERPARIVPPGPSATLFGAVEMAAPGPEHAARVRAGLVQRVGEDGLERLRRALLSEADGVEDDLLRVMERLFEGETGVLDDVRDPAVLRVLRLSGRVACEAHRLHAFVRFERRAGDVWVAALAPDFHVLPLIAPHFEGRYGAQAWAIADVRRGLAIAHTPGAGVSVVEAAPLLALPHADDEGEAQARWRRYFAATTIPERANPRLQRRHMPSRYWAYLTELRPDAPAPERAPLANAATGA